MLWGFCCAFAQFQGFGFVIFVYKRVKNNKKGIDKLGKLRYNIHDNKKEGASYAAILCHK